MKWVFLTTALVNCALAFKWAIDAGYEHRVRVFIGLALAAVGFVVFFVADWRDFERLRRSRESERALSHERAKIVGDFVHRTGRGKHDG